MCHQPERWLSANHRGFITASSRQSQEESYSDPSQGSSQGSPSIRPLSEQTPLPWTALPALGSFSCAGPGGSQFRARALTGFALSPPSCIGAC